MNTNKEHNDDWMEDDDYDNRPKQYKYTLIGDLEPYEDYCMSCHMGTFQGDFLIEQDDDPKKIAEIIAEKTLNCHPRQGWEFYIICDGRKYEMRHLYGGGFNFGIPEIDDILEETFEKAKKEKERKDAKAKKAKEEEEKTLELKRAKQDLEYAQNRIKRLQRGER